MPRMKIEEWWNYTEDDHEGPLPTKVDRSRYVLHSENYSARNGGWADKKKWKAHCRKRKGFLGFQEDGAAKFDAGTAWGIHSYHLVSLGWPDR